MALSKKLAEHYDSMAEEIERHERLYYVLEQPEITDARI